MRIVHREFTVSTGNTILCAGEVRYTFTVRPGLSVDLQEVAVRTNPALEWQPMTGVAFDMLSADVGDDWFLAQIEEGAA